MQPTSLDLALTPRVDSVVVADPFEDVVTVEEDDLTVGGARS
ncbi:hypothetical protein [Egibacter rhizosphaerae]|nr:hypothetical protein [Egibacter rhizosphaerae]